MNEETTNTSRASNPYLVPGAIVLAGVLVAGAVVFGRTTAPANVAAGTGKTIEAEVLPVTEADHVRGPSNPDVYLIEYADYQCPYCDSFHKTVQEVLKEYEGKVAWVFRYFPLDSIHPEARPASIAAECAASLGGNDAFWSFTDKIFANQRDMSREAYISVATGLGVDKAAFEACLDTGDDTRVERDLKNGMDLGGNGTPYTVLLTRKGDILKFSGALPIAQVKTLVDRALASIKK